MIHSLKYVLSKLSLKKKKNQKNRLILGDKEVVVYVSVNVLMC